MNIPETLARKREEAIYLNDLLRSYIEDHEDLTDAQKRESADGEFVRDAHIAEGVELEARQTALAKWLNAKGPRREFLWCEERYIARVGRRKLIMPTYEALARSEEGLAFATQIFAMARPGYHPITSASVEALLARARAAQTAD